MSSIYIYSINVKEEGEFDLSSPDDGAATFLDYPKCEYDRDSTVYREGKLTITKFDLENQIISGTFEFTLTKPGCDTIKVTQGRFDMKI